MSTRRSKRVLEREQKEEPAEKKQKEEPQQVQEDRAALEAACAFAKKYPNDISIEEQFDDYAKARSGIISKLRRLEDEVDKAYASVLFYELLNQIMKEPQEDYHTFQARIFCGRAFTYLRKRLRDAGSVCGTECTRWHLYEDKLSGD